MAIGVDEEKANGLWTGIVLRNNKDASEDEIKSEDVEQRLRKSSRLADASATFQEKAQSAWQEMMKVKSADDGADGAGPGAGAGSWLNKSPMAEKLTQAESLDLSIKAVAKRLPIERTNLLPAFAVLETASAMKSADSERSLELLTENIKEQCTLMSQLATSTRTVTNELMQLVKKRKAAQQKVDEKKKTEAMKAEEQQGEKEKLRLQKKKIMNPFFLDFKAVEKAKVITDADFTKLTDDDYQKPFMLSESKLISAFTAPADDESNALSSTLGTWKTAFPGAKQFQSHGAVIAPLTKLRSDDAKLLDLTSKLLPDSITNEFPRYACAVGTWYFYGESDMFISTDFESELVGSLRVQIGGATQFYGMPLTAIVDACGAVKARAKDFKNFLAEMNQDRLASIAERALPFVHGTLQPNSALVVPPGWMMSFATVGDGESALVHGLRKGFFLGKNLEASKREFEMMLLKEIGGIANTSWLQFLMTLTDVELKGKPSGGDAPAEKRPSPPDSAIGHVEGGSQAQKRLKIQ